MEPTFCEDITADHVGRGGLHHNMGDRTHLGSARYIGRYANCKRITEKESRQNDRCT